MKRIPLFIAAWAILLYAAPSGAQHQGGHGHASPLVMETITVTAERISEYLKNHPQQGTVVDRDEIVRRNFLNLEETLNGMPGVEVRPSAGIGSRISIRGSGKPGGVLVLLNGRPLNTSQYGGVDLSTIPIDIVRSVTVFKPPVPVWLGPGASDGAISILTHDFRTEEPEKRKGKTRVKGSAGSYGLAEGGFSHTVPLQKGSAMITAAGTHLDGKRTNADKDKGSFSLHWDHKTAEATQFDLNGRYYISEYGSPGPTDNPTPNARQRYEKGSFDFQMRGFAGEIGDYSLKAYADRVDLKDESQSRFTSNLDDVKFGLKADTSWSEENGIWALRLGGILERDDVDHTLSGDHHRVTAGAHAQYDRHFGPVTGTLGLRGDQTTDFEFNPGYSGGLSYAISEKGLIKANAGYTVNMPTLGQLYQPSHGSMDQVRGNPELDEEKIWSYDLGVEYRFRKDRIFQATLFRTDTRDLIVYQRGKDLIYFPVNIHRAWRHGMELLFKYAWESGLEAEISGIIQKSQNRINGKDLPYTPRHKLKTTLKYVFPGMQTRLETVLRYEGDRFSEAQNLASQELDGYITMDLKVIQPFALRAMAWEWFVHIENLFDTDFEIHHGYPDDGVRFTIGVSLTF